MLSTYIGLGVGVLLCLIMLYLIFSVWVAFRIIRHLRLGVRIQLQPLPQTEQNLTVRQFFSEVTDSCIELGFTEILDYKVSGLAENRLTIARFLFNRQTQEVAGAGLIQTLLPNGQYRVERMAGFASLYHDGRVLVSSNSYNRIPTPVIQSEDWAEVAIPDEWDISRLYRIHHWSAHEFARGAMRELPTREQWPGFLKRGIVRPFETQVEFGRLALDSTGEFYRPTFKGALGLALSNIWPFKSLRRGRIRRSARRLQKKLA